MQQELIHHLLLEKNDLANLKYDVDKSYIDEFKNLPSNLNNQKSKINKLDIGKLETIPVGLSKLSNIVKNNVVKNVVYNSQINLFEDKVLDFTNLATKTSLNAKINEVKSEILSITNLDTTTNLTPVKKRIPSVSNLIKKN